MDFLNPKIGGPTVQQVSQMSGPAAATATTSVFSRVINYTLLALVFLIPLLFLPFTSEVREFNKQSLLILGVLIMLVFWVIKILTNRNLAWAKSSLDYILLGYGVIYLVASYFSIDKVSSFMGYWGRFSGSAISAIALILLYFIVINNVRSKRMAASILNIFTASSVLVIVYSLLQLFQVYVFGSFTKTQSFNPIGSMVGLSIFAAISIVVYQWQMMTETSTLKQIVMAVATLLGLVLMFILNAFIGWLVLAMGMIVFLALGMMVSAGQNTNQNWFWKPMLVLVVGILFVAFQILPASLNPRNALTINLPIEIQLSNSATFKLVSNSLASGIKTAAIGSGPGTTGIAFGQIKPPDLNKTVVWSLNFDRASNEFANIIIETGIIGVIAFEAIALLFMIYGFLFLMRQSNHPGRMLALGFYSIWATLFLTHFFYFFNTTFYFLYWLAIGAFMAVVHLTDNSRDSAEVSMSQSPRAALSWMFGSLLMLALILVGAFFEASVYVAEASYNTGVGILNNTNPDFNKVENDFVRAVSLNPYRDVYHLANAQNLIFLASIEAAKKDANVQNVFGWVQNAIAQGQAATSVSPNKASNWSALAQIYNSLHSLDAHGSAVQASHAWEEAIKHDSQNPALYVQLAAAYSDSSTTLDPKILGTGPDSDGDKLSDDMEKKLGSDPHNSDSNGNGVADGDEVLAGLNPAGVGPLDATILKQYQLTDKALLKKAEDTLKKAINIKPDLPDSYIALARVYEEESDLTSAKKDLDGAAVQFPFNANILFEQGRITFNSGDADASEKIFYNVLKLSPKQPDALYSLGIIAENRGDKAKALDYFKQVRAIIGPNVQLDKNINDLTAATSTTTPPAK